MAERREQRRRGAQRHQRIEIGEVARRRRVARPRPQRRRGGAARSPAAASAASPARIAAGREHARLAPRALRPEARRCPARSRRRLCVGAGGVGAPARRRRSPRFPATPGNDDVGRQRSPASDIILRERRQQVLVVGRPEFAARAQRGLDLGQHAAVGEQAIERDVDLVDGRRQVGQQRAPSAAATSRGFGYTARDVEPIASRMYDGENGLSMSRRARRRAAADAQVERVELALA